MAASLCRELLRRDRAGAPRADCRTHASRVHVSDGPGRSRTRNARHDWCAGSATRAPPADRPFRLLVAFRRQTHGATDMFDVVYATARRIPTHRDPGRGCLGRVLAAEVRVSMEASRRHPDRCGAPPGGHARTGGSRRARTSHRQPQQRAEPGLRVDPRRHADCCSGSRVRARLTGVASVWCGRSSERRPGSAAVGRRELYIACRRCLLGPSGNGSHPSGTSVTHPRIPVALVATVA